MVDTHTHLDLCEGPVAEVVARAVEAGVERMLTVGIDDESCRAALAAAEAHEQVWAAIGRHPNSASGLRDADIDGLARLAAHPRCAAIGETGLDFYRDHTPPADQRRAFLAQIELARELRKPLVIHTRGAERETLDLLSGHAADIAVVLHCFSMAAHLDECLDAGWMISFAGNVTYPSATDLAAAAERVPADRILVETDAPYLAPVPRRGRPNEPANVVHTAAFVAALRGQTVEQLEADVEANAARVFGW